MVVKPTDSRFDRQMSYRFYRLRRIKESDPRRGMLLSKQFVNKLDLSLKTQKFSGKDPILVLQFLALFAEEADTVGVAEDTAYPLMGSYMTEPDDQAFRSAKGRGKAGVSCYAEAVNWLLNTYCTPGVLRSAAASMKNLAQRTGENEVDFRTRVRLAASRCGNAFDEMELMSTFIDGLDPRIRPYVARHRESRPRDDSTLDSLISFARDEGDGLRARFGKGTRNVASKVNLMEEMASVHSPLNIGGTEAPDPIGLIGDGMTSQDTNELPPRWTI